uniref:MFS general substrate transporter n=1 Tax=Ganoderma boninense TaxID=34458 RepID=A0A5K1JUX8_9APHY|nr:Uncharacterized protein [Ganoderma boninense]
MSSSPSTDKEKLSTEIVTVDHVPLSSSLAVDQKKVLRKLDLRLMPSACLLFLFYALGISNITNAEVAGMGRNLHFTGVQFNLCVALTLIPSCLLPSPSRSLIRGRLRRNILLKKIGPARWLPLIMFVWGSIVVSMAFAKNFAGLMMLGGLAGWCWIFLCEGLITVLIAIILFFYMYDYPENAAFLTAAERAWLLETLKLDSAGGSKKFKRKFIVQAICDPKMYLFASLYFLSSIPVVSFSTFLPTIINGMGFSSTNSQILTAPPLVAACFVTFCVSYLSDKKHLRGPFILACCPIAILGYALLIATKALAAQYVGSVLVLAGLVPAVAMQLSWTGGNFAGELKRAVVIGLVLGFGGFGGQVFRGPFTDSDG